MTFQDGLLKEGMEREGERNVRKKTKFFFKQLDAAIKAKYLSSRG